jgi:hypothetical protein
MRVKDKVERVLSLKPETRDNDKLLMLYVWQIEGLNLSENQLKKWKEVSSPESIRRMRQKMQEDGMYRASEKVEEQRYQMYVETKDAISQAPQAVSWLSD